MNHRQLPNHRAQQDSNRTPGLESLLTYKKQAERQARVAEAHLVAARNVLETADVAQRDTLVIWQEYSHVYNQWQTAQQFQAAVKAGETRISECTYRILLAGVLAVGFLVLAAIQVTSSSLLVVMLLGFLPCLVYIGAKSRQLRLAQCALPRNGVGDPSTLWKGAEKWRLRYERASADAQYKNAERPILVSRCQQALKDLSEWEFKVREAEVKIRAQVSLERTQRQQSHHS